MLQRLPAARRIASTLHRQHIFAASSSSASSSSASASFHTQSHHAAASSSPVKPTDAATPAASVASSSSTPSRPITPKPIIKTLANTSADLRRIYREQQRQADIQRELFPWEITQTKVTQWEPKYEDEKKFYYASKIQEEKKNLDGKTFSRYLSTYGNRYLLSKRLLPSGAQLPSIDMTNQKTFHLELQMPSNILHYWYMNVQTRQRPAFTNPSNPIEASRTTSKAPKVLRVNFSHDNAYTFLSVLHELWPRKDERDYTWKTLPRREHGQYRLELRRVLAEGPSKQLNTVTQTFIDHLQYQLTFHFQESKLQSRNMNWLQFIGIPGIKISKKLGGEIKIPTLRLQ